MSNDDAPGYISRDPAADIRYLPGSVFRINLVGITGYSTRAPQHGMSQSHQQPQNKEHVEQLQDHTSEMNPDVNSRFLVPSGAIPIFCQILSDRKTK